MKTKSVNSQLLLRLRGRRSREVIAHDLRRLGHGTDAKSIWRYETGRNQPSARLLPDYAAVLGVEVASLFSEDGDSGDDDEESDPAMREAFALFVDLMARLQTRQRAEETRL